MNIDLELYRIFYIVAKHQNVTKASKELCISQPAVSKHIHHLEEQLGIVLFTRTQKGLILTESGKSILKDVKQALMLLEHSSNRALDYKELRKGTISIGISTTLTKIFLIKYLTIFHKKYPNIMIEISTDDSSTLKEKLKDGQIDLLFSKITTKDLISFSGRKLGTLHYVFVCNKEFYQKLHGVITKENLEKYPLILQTMKSNSRKIFEAFCLKNDIIIESIMDIDSSNLLISFIECGFGIGFITKEYAENEIKEKKLYELSCSFELPEQDFGYLFLKDDFSNVAVKKLIELISNKI